MYRGKHKEEYIKAFIENDKMGALVEAKFISLDHDCCVYEYEARMEHHNPTGVLHGGALFTAMDSCQGMFVIGILDEKYQTAATGTATIKYTAPVYSGKIKIRTHLIGTEGRKLFVQSEARSEEGQLVAVVDEVWIAILRK